MAVVDLRLYIPSNEAISEAIPLVHCIFEHKTISDIKCFAQRNSFRKTFIKPIDGFGFGKHG
jgi:hypothetical protein